MNDHPTARGGFDQVHLTNGSTTLRSHATGETFHPVLGPEEEARTLYIGPSGIEDRWAAGGEVLVWDVGLGAAGNAAAVWSHWSRALFGSCELRSFDLNLDALSAAERFHRERPESFSYLGQVPREAWDELKAGRPWSVEQGRRWFLWEWHLGDFTQLCPRLGKENFAVPDLVFYDSYSPARNPDMWSLAHWKRLHAFLKDGKGTSVYFYSRSTALRVTLLLAGFYVGTGVAIAGKEETTVAATRPELLAHPLGANFVAKVERSTNARPFQETYDPGPIMPGDLKALRKHPQFSG
jgi:tRNA U34 5-methylaminomethyl-2-thiouridine-forming methyltransferase MnmC